MVCVCWFTYYWCEKYKSIPAQYYVADFASWVPRLTLLDLKTNCRRMALKHVYYHVRIESPVYV